MNFKKEQIYFTSDQHFNHLNVIKHSERPYSSVEEMNEKLVDNWNRTVPIDGVVFHLGDLFWRKNVASEELGKQIIHNLNGKIYTLNGNHDVKGFGAVKRKEDKFYSDFQKITELGDYFEVTIDGQEIVMCHYAILSWNKAHHGSWNLFGHSHGNLKTFIDKNLPNSKMLDVGVDNIANNVLGKTQENYRPISFFEVEEYMSKKSGINNIDHH